MKLLLIIFVDVDKLMCINEALGYGVLFPSSWNTIFFIVNVIINGFLYNLVPGFAYYNVVAYTVEE